MPWPHPPATVDTIGAPSPPRTPAPAPAGAAIAPDAAIITPAIAAKPAMRAPDNIADAVFIRFSSFAGSRALLPVGLAGQRSGPETIGVLLQNTRQSVAWRRAAAIPEIP